jgi:hypothetical protein
MTKGLDDVSTASLSPLASLCPYPEVVDDLFICIVYGDVDGLHGTLGVSLMDLARTFNGRPFVGYFFVDQADIPNLKAGGIFISVFLHTKLMVLLAHNMWYAAAQRRDVAVITEAGSGVPKPRSGAAYYQSN